MFGGDEFRRLDKKLTRRDIYSSVASALDALDHDAPRDAAVVLIELQEELLSEGIEE